MPSATAAISASDLHRVILAAWRIEQPRLITSLARMLRDVPLAEDLTQDTLLAALEHWSKTGVPENPGAWLMMAARRRALDHLRRAKMLARKHDVIQSDLEREQRTMPDPDAALDDELGDELLRLLFTACHPLLSREARAALALRMVCGLTTGEIARAFLIPEPTVAQRIVRAKRTLSESGLTYETPRGEELSERLASVLEVVYLVFNEGYTASSGAELMRLDLASEAIRLGRLLVEMLPETEAIGLLALMLLHDSRRAARASSAGELIVLEEQDRSLWDRKQIEEGSALVERALSSRRFGPYSLQAAIAAMHCDAARAADTDWNEIVYLYDLLLRIEHTPVVELNRAVAVAMRDGPATGLALIDELLARGDLQGYRLAHAARADLCRRLGRTAEARASYTRAHALTQSEPERQFLQRRLAELPRD